MTFGEEAEPVVVDAFRTLTLADSCTPSTTSTPARSPAACIASTARDMHGAVCGGIAALKGPLHGGANEMAMEMLKEIASTRTSPSRRQDHALMSG